jgi:hypothetical protein
MSEGGCPEWGVRWVVGEEDWGHACSVAAKSAAELEVEVFFWLENYVRYVFDWGRLAYADYHVVAVWQELERLGYHCGGEMGGASPVADYYGFWVFT